MKIEEGKTYLLLNLAKVSFKRNNLPYYKFSIVESSEDFGVGEVFTEDGIGYHNDCGYEVIGEI